MRSALEADGPFGRFAARVLAAELPDLPDERVAETVGFVCKRAAQTAGPSRLGVIVLALLVGVSERAIDPATSTTFLRTTSLPLVSELARLVRSLAFAYVWETWPGTSPTGRPESSEVAP